MAFTLLLTRSAFSVCHLPCFKPPGKVLSFGMAHQACRQLYHMVGQSDVMGRSLQEECCVETKSHMQFLMRINPYFAEEVI